MMDEPGDDRIEELAAEAMVLAMSSGLSLNQAARGFWYGKPTTRGAGDRHAR
jgi:hypothetical protein